MVKNFFCCFFFKTNRVSHQGPLHPWRAENGHYGEEGVCPHVFCGAVMSVNRGTCGSSCAFGPRGYPLEASFLGQLCRILHFARVFSRVDIAHTGYVCNVERHSMSMLQGSLTNSFFHRTAYISTKKPA